MSTAVWDASALLLLLQQEPGWERLSSRLPGGVMSSVNLSEVAAKLMEAGGAPRKTRDVLESLPLTIYDFTVDLAYRAAELRETTEVLGLSLGDRACLALGIDLELIVLTADQAWLEIDLGAQVELVRPGD